MFQFNKQDKSEKSDKNEVFQITFRLAYFCCSVARPDIDSTCWMWASQKWANYFVNGVKGNPRSFSIVTHSSWCPVEFGQVPICGQEDICHNLIFSK